MSNPLIEKYFEIYPEKKEKPKLPRIEDYKGEKTIADELKELSTSVTGVNPNSVSAITAANPYPKLTSYDVDSSRDSFLQIAEKIQKGEAKVVYMSMNMEHYVKSVTFEVQVYT